MNTNKPDDRYCYVEPEFPDEAFVGYLSVVKDSSLSFLYPFTTIFSTIRDFQKDSSLLHTNLSIPDMRIDEQAILLPIRFKRRIRLKKTYWTNSLPRYPLGNRIPQFIAAARFYSLHQILVTPWTLSEFPHVFAAALACSNGASDKSIEQFMLHSNFPVDKKSKYAALYWVEEPFGIEWKTGKVLKAGAVHITGKPH